MAFMDAYLFHSNSKTRIFKAGHTVPCLIRLAQSPLATNHYRLNFQMVGLVVSNCYAQSWSTVFPAWISRKLALPTLASAFGAPPT